MEGKRIDMSHGSDGAKLSWLVDFWKEWRSMLIAFAVIIILLKVIFQVAWVPTGSMETTLPTHSVQFCWRLPFVFGDPLPERGDVITFWSDEENEVMVKRCIGLPGEEVSFRDGYVYVNGELLSEPYLSVPGITNCSETFTVPQGCVFFMGDNRTGSYDGRFWQNHYISADKLQAKVLVCFSIGSQQSWQGVHLIK